MSQKRVIYTDSTTAECTGVLKMINFQEDIRDGSWVEPEGGGIKVYLCWGKNEYFPELHVRLAFTPRVQIHLEANEGAVEIDGLSRVLTTALKDLDPNCKVQVFNAVTRMEMS